MATLHQAVSVCGARSCAAGAGPAWCHLESNESDYVRRDFCADSDAKLTGSPAVSAAQHAADHIAGDLVTRALAMALDAGAFATGSTASVRAIGLCDWRLLWRRERDDNAASAAAGRASCGGEAVCVRRGRAEGSLGPCPRVGETVCQLLERGLEEPRTRACRGEA